jgi:hypothetical protein
MRRIFAILIGIPGLLSVAWAQTPPPQCAAAIEAKCGCAVPLQAGQPANVARLLEMQGTVLVSREAGFANASTGAQLTLGDRVITGENSRAELLIAEQCNLGFPRARW